MLQQKFETADMRKQNPHQGPNPSDLDVVSEFDEVAELDLCTISTLCPDVQAVAGLIARSMLMTVEIDL